MSIFDGPIDPPEPSAYDVMEEAEWVADQITAEWAQGAEVELYIGVSLTRSMEPQWIISSVRRDGELLYGGPRGTDANFESVEEMREWLTEHYPLDPEKLE